MGGRQTPRADEARARSGESTRTRGPWPLLALLAATWLIAPLALLLGLPDGAPSFYVMPVAAVLGGLQASRLRDALVLPGLAMLLPSAFVLAEGILAGTPSPSVLLGDAGWVALIHVVPVAVLAGLVHGASARLGDRVRRAPG